MLVRYLIHPQSLDNASSPQSACTLDDDARVRAEALARSGLLDGTAYIFSSSHAMASQTASIIGDSLSIPPNVDAEMDESENLVTGALPQAGLVDRFKRLCSANQPPVVAQGEYAMDAQDRIAAAYLSAMERVLTSGMRGDVLMVGHGRVGALLFCYLAGQGIGAEFTPPPAGYYFTYDWGARKMLHGWQAMEEA
ncbi:histidine phosphatase family protein [uncultured Cohaesibacter sp.]|uniref:histidine phosphatase family protein n=1 Tax=uncultured Cohaesibacter sp. TaxID=1002546 RepID=UPI002AAB9E8A|nr:histidine phosphatase family protein [uncultured Cohaesibacter sp.]